MEITSVLFDPGLGCSAFTVEGINCTRSCRGMTSHSVTAQALGCIHPGTPEMRGIFNRRRSALWRRLVSDDLRIGRAGPAENRQ